jgi:hypothetical protein
MQKKYWAIAAAVVVIIVIVLVASRNSKNNSPSGTSQENQQPISQSTSTSPSATTTPTSTPVTTGGSSNNLSYNQALAIYGKNGYRIQFAKCSGNPGHLAIKQGVKFMLDNRDNAVHTIVVKSQTFHLGKYGFAIATAKDLGVYNITCDGGGSAQLNVEK